MFRSLCCLVITLVLLSGNGVLCQDFPMLHYTIDEGLPGNTVYSTYRDSKGFLWVGTDKGIARYNGIKFEKFTTFDGPPDNEIFFFHEDPLGRLWLAAYNGELCYYKDGVFHTARNTPFLKLPFKASFVRQITTEYDSSVNILYTDEALKFVNIHGDQCRVFYLNQLTDKERFGEIIYKKKLSESRYKLTFTNKIITVDTPLTTANIIEERDNKYQNAITPFWINFLSQNNNYIITRKYIFSPDLDIIQNKDLDKYIKKTLYLLYTNGKDWLYCTNDGLYINDSIHILKGFKISGVTQDGQGNYWASTLGNGLFVINKDLVNAKMYRKAYEPPLQYCTSGRHGLVFVDAEKKIKILKGNNIETLMGYKKLVPQEPKYFHKIHGLFIDANDRFYDCYVNGGVIADNIFSNRPAIKKYTTNMNRNDEIHNISYAGGKIYVNTRTRIISFDFKNVTNGAFVNYETVSDSINKELIFDLARAYDNTIWYSTINNLFHIDHSKALADSLYYNIVFRSFTFCGKYLIGFTHNNQLLICNRAAGTTITDSVTNQNCVWYKLYKLDDAHLLISTADKYRIITLRPSAGKPDWSIAIIEDPSIPQDAEAICADSSNCYFFKNGAITSFSLQNLLLKPGPPKLFFTFLKAGKTAYPIRSETAISYSSSKNLNISIGAISGSGKEITYQYSISRNEQDNWTEINVNEINLVNPHFGSYTVKVRAKTISSDYSKPIIFSLVIGRPFWARWWFITLVTIFIVALLFSIVIVTRKLVLQAAKRKSMQMELELKSIYAQINPHFIFNTLNSALLLVSKNRMEEAYVHISKFSRLLRGYIKSSRNKLISVKEEITNLGDYIELQQTRFKNKFAYEVIVDPAIDPAKLKIPSLLLQPFVENAINHGILQKKETGHLKLQFALNEAKNELLCTIEDDGIGRAQSKFLNEDKDRKEGSYGDLLIKDLVSIFNNYEHMNIWINYEDKSAPLTGTIVTIKIKNPHYDQ